MLSDIFRAGIAEKEVEKLQAENARLRELVQEAYFEGWYSFSDFVLSPDLEYLSSKSHAALTKEG